MDPAFEFDEAQQRVYGMSIDEWKRDYQTEASEEQQRQFQESKPLHARITGY
ncbi:MAG TPA: DUF1244 domain-containing protein [Gammaproteobacteria bacterium]|nr:DUF1244 domain-containing protein [Gammaproteobacteria bacterium]